jgi:hypothetical protein
MTDLHTDDAGCFDPDRTPLYVRGYCRICNRHYFFRHQLDPDHTQYHQHHTGVCQRCRYACARIKPKAKLTVPLPRGEAVAAIPIAE